MKYIIRIRNLYLRRTNDFVKNKNNAAKFDLEQAYNLKACIDNKYNLKVIVEEIV